MMKQSLVNFKKNSKNIENKDTFLTKEYKKLKFDMKNYVIHDLPDYFKQYKKSIKNQKNSGTKLRMKTLFGITLEQKW